MQGLIMNINKIASKNSDFLTASFEGDRFLKARQQDLNAILTKGTGAPYKTSKHLKLYLKRVGLSVKESIFSDVEQYTISEIYSVTGSNFVQQWANLPFYEFCSYSLKTLIQTPFHELYERPEFVNHQIIKTVGEVFQTQDKVCFTDMTHHLIDKSNNTTQEISMGFLAPVFNEANEIVAMIATMTPKRLDH